MALVDASLRELLEAVRVKITRWKKQSDDLVLDLLREKVELSRVAKELKADLAEATLEKQLAEQKAEELEEILQTINDLAFGPSFPETREVEYPKIVRTFNLEKEAVPRKLAKENGKSGPDSRVIRYDEGVPVVRKVKRALTVEEMLEAAKRKPSKKPDELVAQEPDGSVTRPKKGMSRGVLAASGFISAAVGLFFGFYMSYGSVNVPLFIGSLIGSVVIMNLLVSGVEALRRRGRSSEDKVEKEESDSGPYGPGEPPLPSSDEAKASEPGYESLIDDIFGGDDGEDQEEQRGS